jgi:effector-binding domain-containing protein
MNSTACLLVVLTAMLKLFSSPAVASIHTLTTPKEINYMIQDTARKPTVGLEETTVDSMIILVIKDTATSMEDISRVIGAGYGELFTFINQTGLIPGKVMAFYYTYQPPFKMDIAVEVNKIPAQTTGRIKLNKIFGGKAIVARYRGPYEKVEIAYTAIADWLKQHQQEAKGLPFEVYLNDPATVKDPYELRTDVYQLTRN